MDKLKAMKTREESEIDIFFRKYNINPILPDFPLTPVIELYEQYPNVISLKYELFNANEDWNKRISDFAIKVDKEMKKTDVEGMFKAKDDSYYITNRIDNELDCFFVLIEAVVDDNMMPIIAKAYQQASKNNIQIEDAPEEVMEQDYE